MDYDSCSDYEYCSDNEYESDSEIDNISIADIQIVDVSIDTPQRQWIILCKKFEKYYKNTCTYDELSVYFTIGNKGFRLFLENNKQSYPYIAPQIEYTGSSQIPLEDYLMIMNNITLSKTHWNICNDIPMFVEQVMQIMERSEEYKFILMDNIIVDLVQTLSIKYSFSDELLPTFGENNNSIKHSGNGGYLRGAEKISKFVSTIEKIDPYLEQLLTLEDPKYNKYLKEIIQHLTNSKITRLELIMNEQYYKNIGLVSQKFSLDIDLSNIEQIESKHTNKFQFVDTFAEHTWKKDKSFAKSSLAKRIFAEIETIKDSISDFQCYVLVSEENIQQMKVLFIPDYDTPYAGGYFEFDMFIPTNYPAEPPKLKFLTTDNGKVRFNPNLYNCGKVCLSIINTWSTNQWDAKTSTISQVLLSINSMIFIEHPYTNEPAYYNALENKFGRDASDNYSKKIRLECARVAIKNQLANTRTPFESIIKSHWEKTKEKTQSHYTSLWID